MKEMDKSIKILIIMAVITIALFGLKTYLNNHNKVDYSTLDYIELNGENIPSIYKIIGDKKIIKTDKGIDSKGNYIELIYKELTLKEVTDYLAEFKNYNYILIDSNKNSAVIANESKDNNKIITITVNYSKDETKIKYSKGNGTLTRD